MKRMYVIGVGVMILAVVLAGCSNLAGGGGTYFVPSISTGDILGSWDYAEDHGVYKFTADFGYSCDDNWINMIGTYSPGDTLIITITSVSGDALAFMGPDPWLKPGYIETATLEWEDANTVVMTLQNDQPGKRVQANVDTETVTPD
jgi:hypothetical protein